MIQGLLMSSKCKVRVERCKCTVAAFLLDGLSFFLHVCMNVLSRQDTKGWLRNVRVLGTKGCTSYAQWPRGMPCARKTPVRAHLQRIGHDLNRERMRMAYVKGVSVIAQCTLFSWMANTTHQKHMCFLNLWTDDQNILSRAFLIYAYHFASTQ